MGCYKTSVRGESIKYGAQKKKTCWKWYSENWTKIKDIEESLKDNDDNQQWDQLYAYEKWMN